MSEIFLALGSNMGERASYLHKALDALRALPSIDNFVCSNFYSTSPVGDGPAQNDFLNCVCRATTTLDAESLLKELQTIEKKLGKEKKPKNHPRPIDIDILFYGQEFHQTPNLEIPHPRWLERLFVLIPLNDLVEKISVPEVSVKGKIRHYTISEMIKNFKNSEIPKQKVVKYETCSC